MFTPEYYHVRINSKRSQPNSDFDKFFTSMRHTRYGIWDSDKSNNIRDGDYLGFITGPKNNELVYIYKVTKVLPVEKRPDHWESESSHTTNNIFPVNKRLPIELTNHHSLPKTCEWKEIREKTGLGSGRDGWMPRGTSRVAMKTLLPFAELIE